MNDKYLPYFTKKITKVYFVIISSLIVTFSFVVFFLFGNKIQSSLHTNNLQICENTSNLVNTYFTQIDILTSSLTYDEEIIKALSEHQKPTSKTENNIALHLAAVHYSVPNSYRIMIINNDLDQYYTYGYEKDESEFIQKNLHKFEKYKNLISESENFYISDPHLDFWSKSPQYVISYIKKIDSFYGACLGFVEIQMPYNEIARLFDLQKTDDDLEISIISKGGNFIYPIDGTALGEKEKDYLRSVNDSNGHFSTKKNYTYNVSTETSWVILLEQAKKPTLLIYAGIVILSNFILLFIIHIILIQIAKNLNRPLVMLIEKVQNFSNEYCDAESFENLSYKTKDNNEIVFINNTFSYIQNKLQTIVEEKYVAELREEKAVLLALQAQMDPHFLFNALQVISMASSDNKNMAVAEMCHSLSDLLKYSISGGDKGVLLCTELKQTENYLKLMKYQYEDNLEYCIKVSGEVSQIIIPKLTIQPFVENCIKHGLKDSVQKWCIQVQVTLLSSDYFVIVISDNGVGFSESQLEKFNLYASENTLNSKNILAFENGHGVLNTVYRLRFFYNKEVDVRFQNLLPQGAEISIKGKVLGGAIH